MMTDYGKTTQEQSLGQLENAQAALTTVYMTLVETNAYADGARPELDQALHTLRAALNERVRHWSRDDDAETTLADHLRKVHCLFVPEGEDEDESQERHEAEHKFGKWFHPVNDVYTYIEEGV